MLDTENQDNEHKDICLNFNETVMGDNPLQLGIFLLCIKISKVTRMLKAENILIWMYWKPLLTEYLEVVQNFI